MLWSKNFTWCQCEVHTVNPPNEWKKLDLVRKLCWDKMSDYRKQVGLSQADIRMTSWAWRIMGQAAKHSHFLTLRMTLAPLALEQTLRLTPLMSHANVFSHLFPSKKIDNSGRWLRLSLHPAESVPAPWGNPQVKIKQLFPSCTNNILESRSKLVIHEVDEPPLGVPGELHFDDEEEEVERGGWAFIHFIIVSIITSWRMH